VVWNHKARIALFLAAMHHFRDALTAVGLPVLCVELEAPAPPGLPERLRAVIDELRPQRVLACEPGEWRLKVVLAARAAESGVPLEWCADTHFLASTADLERWAAGRSGLRMEFFYREQRRRHGVLLDGVDPVGAGISTVRTGAVFRRPDQVRCLQRRALRRTRSPARYCPWSRGASRRILASSPISTGRSPPHRPTPCSMPA